MFDVKGENPARLIEGNVLQTYKKDELTDIVSSIGATAKNIAKGTMDPRVEFISQVLTQILINFQFQNLDGFGSHPLGRAMSLSKKPVNNVQL